MKKLLLLFSFWPLFAFGQIIIDFESGLTGDWEQFPLNRWESSGADPLSGTQSLHHIYDNPLAGTDIISLKTGIINPDSLISWEFIIRHAYPPSSSNRWIILLLADMPAERMNDKGKFNGYGFGVNLTTSDDSLRFYVFREGIPVSNKSLGMNYELEAGSMPYHFRIYRNIPGSWEFEGNLPGEESRMLYQLNFADKMIFRARYFGLRYTYTLARDRLFWLDDLKIMADFIADTIPPVITESRTLSNRLIKIIFSEEVDPISVKRENMILSPGDIQPDSFMLNGNEIKLFFGGDFKQAQDYKLVLTGITDTEGNIANGLFVDFLWYEAGIYDLIINEIMADPLPLVYLPDKEYIEIYNRSNYSIEMDSFVISTGLKNWIIPESSIQSRGYLVISNQGGDEAFPGINTIALFQSPAVISNEGQQIALIDKRGRVLSAVEFSKNWYEDNFKSEGGWSLERVDYSNVCGESINWRASGDPSGGTPGKENSVIAENPDLERPGVDRIVFHKANKIEIGFTESMNPYTLSEPSMFIADESSMLPDSINPKRPFYKSVEITYPESFRRGKIYGFRLPESVTDCSGNALKIDQSIRFGIPVACQFLDVLISEILYAPLAGCPEFIELYNNSDSLLELSDLRILAGENGEGITKMISVEPVLFFPGEYLAITRDRNALMDFYDISDPERIIENVDLPSFQNEGMCIKILNRSMETVDEYCYSPGDQFVLLTDPNGVSLERLKLDRFTGDQALWHSSSSLAGYATPGYENSQKLNEELNVSGFEIIPEVFTPDNDGRDDIMICSYLFEKEGYTGTVCIFDPSGRKVRYLGRNLILGTKGSLSWDGCDESGRLCRLGIYLVYMEAFHPSAKVIKHKKVVVLAKYGK